MKGKRPSPVTRDELVDLIVHARIRIEREVEAILRGERLKLGFTHWSVLKQLDAQVGRAMGELHRATAIDTSTMTKVVDALVAFGFVYRLPDPDDRRKVLICLTETGETLVARLTRRIERRQREIMPDIGPTSTGQIASYLAAIAA